MRKLTPNEQHALTVLRDIGSYCPGTDSGGLVLVAVRQALDGLVKKKRAIREDTQDGPRYWPVGDADAL